MKEVFAPEARKKLKAMGLERALYAFDFDGTLSGVVARPDEAKMRATTRELLGVLARRVPVAIVSGRAVADLRQHVMGIPARLIGNHGLEGIGLGPEALRAARRVCKDWVRELKDPIFGPRVGIELEDKTYTLSVHYRNCPDRRAAKLSILQAASSLQPQPRILPGKCVVNLLPPGAPHKGVALVELMLEYDLHRAFYVGDDETDEDVFSLSNTSIFTVRVGEKTTSMAQYFIKSQPDVDRLLEALVALHA